MERGNGSTSLELMVRNMREVNNAHEKSSRGGGNNSRPPNVSKCENPVVNIFKLFVVVF